MSGMVAIVIESLGGGGAQHVATTLANAWCSDGVKVTVITFRAPESDVFALDPRVRRIVIGGSDESRNLPWAILSNIRRIRRLRTALRQTGAGLVLGFIGTTNVLTVLASIGLGMRVAIAERNDPRRQSLGFVWNLLRRFTYHHADLVIANSKSAIVTMSAYVPAQRLHWLPNPLRTVVGSSCDSVLVASPFFLAAGRLDRQKAYDVLLDAFSTIKDDLPDWNLAILGDGPLRNDLENKAAKLGVSSRVHFVGYVANPFPWYRAAKIFVHPARFEGLPNVVIEAMSERLPVIVTDAQEGLREIVINGESGLIVPTDVPAALATVMVQMARDSGLRLRLGLAAFDAVKVYQAEQAVSLWTTTLEFPMSQNASPTRSGLAQKFLFGLYKLLANR